VRSFARSLQHLTACSFVLMASWMAAVASVEFESVPTISIPLSCVVRGALHGRQEPVGGCVGQEGGAPEAEEQV
jgi:hypothetical protein